MSKQSSLPNLDVDQTEMVAYLCQRAYGITGGGVSRALFQDALKEQPLDKLRAMYYSARDEQQRRMQRRKKSRG